MTTSKIKPSTWQVIEPKFKPENQHHLETILTQGNGYLSTRGSFEERFPSDRQATFIHGLWDDIPIVFTELVNAPDWSSLELWINGERFRLDQGLISQYRRVLNLKTGILSRSILWSSSETGPRFKLSFERFESNHS